MKKPAIFLALIVCMVLIINLVGRSDKSDTYTPTYTSSDRSSSPSVPSGIHRDDPIAMTYIGNSSTKKFHRHTCEYLPDKANQVTFSTRERAIAAGYNPCAHCKP